MYQRIVIKLGTSVLTGGTRRLDRARMVELVRQCAQLHAAGREIIIVTSGAIAAGRERLGYPDLPPTVANKQMLAAVGQSRLMLTWESLFEIYSIHVGQMLLTREDFRSRPRYLNARDMLNALLEQRIVRELETWNLFVEVDSFAAAAYEVMRIHLLDLVFGAKLGPLGSSFNGISFSDIFAASAFSGKSSLALASRGNRSVSGGPRAAAGGRGPAAASAKREQEQAPVELAQGGRGRRGLGNRNEWVRGRAASAEQVGRPLTRPNPGGTAGDGLSREGRGRSNWRPRASA